MMRKEEKLTFEEMIKGRLNLLPKLKRSLRDQSLRNQKRKKENQSRKKKENQSRKKKEKLMKLKNSKEFYELLLVFGSCL